MTSWRGYVWVPSTAMFSVSWWMFALLIPKRKEKYQLVSAKLLISQGCNTVTHEEAMYRTNTMKL